MIRCREIQVSKNEFIKTRQEFRISENNQNMKGYVEKQEEVAKMFKEYLEIILDNFTVEAEFS